MQAIPADLREFIELLNSNGVKYVIVGGYAVAFHGHPRTTGDIDFLIEVSEENANRLITVLVDFGFGSLGLSAADFSVPGVVVQLGYPPSRIDLVTSIDGVSFDHVWDRRIVATVQGLTTAIIDKASLIKNKAASGRAKDLADLEALA